MNFRATFSGHLPSVIFAVLSLVIGFQIWLIGLLADLIASSRRLVEDTLYRVKRMELELSDLRSRGQMIVERLDGTPAQTDGTDSAKASNGHAVEQPPTPHVLDQAPKNGTASIPPTAPREPGVPVPPSP
jgi:hypothetical protein